MKEDSLLFNELFFRETFKWLADNPDKDYVDCPLWMFNKDLYEGDLYDLPMVCYPAMELCTLDEEKANFTFPETKNILYKRRKAIQKRKCVMGVCHCVYCPIEWPVRKWTGGFMIRHKPHLGLGIIVKEKYYTPCFSNRVFGKGLMYKFYRTKDLKRKSEIARQISELPLTELGERLVSGKYNNYIEVLMSYD